LIFHFEIFFVSWTHNFEFPSFFYVRKRWIKMKICIILCINEYHKIPMNTKFGRCTVAKFGIYWYILAKISEVFQRFDLFFYRFLKLCWKYFQIFKTKSKNWKFFLLFFLLFAYFLQCIYGADVISPCVV